MTAGVSEMLLSNLLRLSPDFQSPVQNTASLNLRIEMSHLTKTKSVISFRQQAGAGTVVCSYWDGPPPLPGSSLMEGQIGFFLW